MTRSQSPDPLKSLPAANAKQDVESPHLMNMGASLGDLKTAREVALEYFRNQIGKDATHLVFAPGRVNLIGEHTDYNGGFVLPMAIEMGIYVAARPREDSKVVVWSEDYNEPLEIDLAESMEKGKPAWGNYIRGVLAGLKNAGVDVNGFDAAIHANMPTGGGLSSSAALEAAFATLGESLSGQKLDPVRKALLCQKAEHEFAGTPCGIMDQFAVVFGQAGHFLLIDCRSQERTPVPMHDDTVSVLVINTMVKHQLTDGGYANRRAACFEAAEAMGVKELRDATLDLVLQSRADLKERVFRRARHVVTEDGRTLAAVEALKIGDWKKLGELMYGSHESLRADFEVSCNELDLVVNLAKSIGLEGGVYGCRMTGGGFGGCCVALVRSDKAEEIAKSIHSDYMAATNLNPTIFVSAPSSGARVLVEAKPARNATQALFASHPHRRRNALTGEWLLVSPHRTQRPWQGRTEAAAADRRPAHDPKCYLCAGNTRANGEKNPDYDATYVFTNDFAALLPDEIPTSPAESELFHAEPVRGTCRVICFSPRHDLSLARMQPADIRRVVDTWAAQAEELSSRWRWVQIFENKGDVMGCSNPHPHGQIWASDTLPNEILKENREQTRYFAAHKTKLLVDYIRLELESGERVVAQNEDWAAVVPYWAVWPFETLLVPKKSAARITDLSDGQRDALSALLPRLLARYDNLFETSFPYSMGWHGAPVDGSDASHWQLHAHFYPPLLRSATVKKFMVGYEMLAEPQRDLTPEAAAARLRELSEVHYLADH